MSKLDFHVEFYSEVRDLPAELRDEAEDRLLALGEGSQDMIGASVGIDELSRDETPHAYEVRVVAYMKPENVAATEKGENLPATLRNALDALERQVRQRRERQRDARRQPRGTPGVPPLVE